MRPIEEFSYIKNNKVVLDSDSLTQLYLPVIGNQATALYHYLNAFFDNGAKRHKFSEILNHLQVSMGDLEEALAILTAIDLLVLYQTRNGYVFKLVQPLSREAFLGNPIYRRLLEKEIGEVAVAELDMSLPQDARDISKNFSDIFSAEAPAIKRSVSKNHFDLGSFQRLMARDGLRFKDEQSDVLTIYGIADKHRLNWFDTYRLAQQTAIGGTISPKRMLVQLEQSKENPAPAGETFSAKEQVILREAKQDSASDFLTKIKSPRHAVVIASERQLLEELANMGFLDEVINIMVLYTLNKTKSANLNKAYILKLANDFAYHKIATAEAAMLQMRSFSQRRKDQKQTAKESKKNIPKWAEQDYKHEATAEEKAKLEALKRSMLED